MKTKTYSKTQANYAYKLREMGYTCKFNWVDESHYEDVTVTGPIWRGHGGEWSTPKAAYDYIRNYVR